ncbi:MAG: amidohydrolase family protein, partial [bacterium]|nr:amidohydrolase family protein [bacterium]
MQRFTADRIRSADGQPIAMLSVDDGLVIEGDASATTGVEHLEGFVVPGLRDAHFHPVTYAASLVVPSLKAARDFDDIAQRLTAVAKDLAPEVPISAIRLDDETLAEGRLPTRRDLDQMLSDRPAIVHRYCGHIAMANSAALRLAGVTAATPDPAGGTLDRDDRGEPTGVLREMGIETVSLPLAKLAGPA